MAGFQTSFMPRPVLSSGRPQMPVVPASRVRPAPARPTPPPVLDIPKFLPDSSWREKRRQAGQRRLEEAQRHLDDVRARFAEAEVKRALAAVLCTQVDLDSEVAIKVQEIATVVSVVSGVPLSDLYSARRMMEVVRPRQVIFWLCRRYTRRSLPEIGRRVGGRDHTTVLHGVRRVERVAPSVTPERDDPEAWARALLAAEWPSYGQRHDRA